ncbi:hypothetical protein GCM10010106_51200 [Thermopolyspora flexuosa]|nr:hypothetical protein GCM10010106_51200 [Thermopolyspora flexuosa]
MSGQHAAREIAPKQHGEKNGDKGQTTTNTPFRFSIVLFHSTVANAHTEEGLLQPPALGMRNKNKQK